MIPPLQFALTPVLGAKLGDFLPLLAILFVVISALRAFIQAQRAKEQHKAEGAESDDERRAREIRERLRRIMAERRGEPLPPEEPAARSEPPPVLEPAPRPATVPPIDPFGGSMRRILDQLDPRPAPPPPAPPPLRRSEPAPVPVAAPVMTAAELGTFDGEGPEAPLVRTNVTFQAADPVEMARRAEARQRLIGDLRDPEALRRAFVLREILGPPVSLRGQR